VSEALREAVVVAAPEDATRSVAGVPLLVRTLLVLQRAGIERVHLVGGDPPADARIRVAVVRNGAPADPHLVIGAGTVVDQRLVRAAVEAGAPLAWQRGAARVERRPPIPARATEPTAGTLLDASAPRARIEDALLRGLENPTDGYLDRVLHRRFSRPTTRLLLRTPITPNQVTVAGVVVGIAGGLLLGSASATGVLAGVVALVVSGVLDCSDGEIARIKFTESRMGHLLDITGDTLVHAALLFGIVRYLARIEALPDAGTLTLLCVGVVGSFAAITWSEHTVARRHRVAGAWENRVLDGVLSPLTTRDWYVFPVAFAVAGRLDVLVPAAAWGAQLFWVAALTLVWRVLRREPPA
jgi:phosphatidylglycerophosphate synthase